MEPTNINSQSCHLPMCHLIYRIQFSGVLHWNDNQECLLVGEVKQNYISRHRLDGSHINSIKVNISPRYIAVTSTDKIIISSPSWPGTVQILDPTGNTLHTLNPPSCVPYMCPCGICCTAGDDIYISNNQSASMGGGIYCYSISGQYVGCVTKEVNCPTGVTLSEDDNKLIVVEKDRVKIFSRQ